jgi:hypothetical protein
METDQALQMLCFQETKMVDKYPELLNAIVKNISA